MSSFCQQCKTKVTFLLDVRFTHKKVEVYILQDDGILPSPTGFCIECGKKQILQEIDLFYNINARP